MLTDINGYIMSMDTPVARINNGRITPILKALMPLYLQDRDHLEGWLEGRAIDRHRPNSRILKKVLRITDTSDVSTVLHAHAATITDHFWLKPDSEPDLSWSQVLFHDNSYDEVALTGCFSSYNKEYPAAKRTTPELTNVGSYEKCWRRDKVSGRWYMYKQGSPLERFSELFTYRLGVAMKLDMAVYEAADGYIRSQDFTGHNLDFEPASALMGDNEDYTDNYDCISQHWPSLIPQYLDILFMDALVFNVDRHTGNYGFLRDTQSGQVLRMAPNFDNNIALISRGYESSPLKSNGMLIDFFVDLLKDRHQSYFVPDLSVETVKRLARDTLPEEDIRRDYVVDFIIDRYTRIEERVRQLTPNFYQGNDLRAPEQDDEWEP